MLAECGMFVNKYIWSPTSFFFYSIAPYCFLEETKIIFSMIGEDFRELDPTQIGLLKPKFKIPFFFSYFASTLSVTQVYSTFKSPTQPCPTSFTASALVHALTVFLLFVTAVTL